MKRMIQFAVLTAVLSGSAVADDGLDEALAELKQKARRQSYSTRANLDIQSLAVPEEQREEDKELDKKLREVEKELDRRALPMSGSAAALPRMPRPASSRPQENRNWLTPALLNANADEDTVFDEEAPGWVEIELERQKNIRLEEAALREESGNSRLFKNPFQTQQETPDSKLNEYSQSFQNILSARHSEPDQKTDSLPGWRSTPEKERPDSPFSLSRRNEQKQESSAGAFSQIKPAGSVFEVKRRSDSQSPLRIGPTYGSAEESATAPRSLAPSWKKDEESRLLQPIERIRKASPIHKKDPFAEDLMPQIKRSIWE
jgi:hypothetical protein